MTRDLVWAVAEAIAASRRQVVPAGPPPTSNRMNRKQIEGYIPAARAAIKVIAAKLDAQGDTND